LAKLAQNRSTCNHSIVRKQRPKYMYSIFGVRCHYVRWNYTAPYPFWQPRPAARWKSWLSVGKRPFWGYLLVSMGFCKMP
jgi:hypothetical protein